MTEHNASLVVKGPNIPCLAEVLSDNAMNLIDEIEHRFGQRRRDAMSARQNFQARLDAGDIPCFPVETATIRNSDWKVRPAPSTLLDRRVEITGPVDRKMVINALNSGANAFMADFEDSSTPTWANMVQGQINLRDAAAGTIAYSDPKTGKQYVLKESPAILMVRPRGLHMEECHVTRNGQAVSAAFFDFAVFMASSAKALLEKGAGPYFYLPKLEHYLEARLWNDVICFTEDWLGLKRGTVRVTVLIETVTAAFQMDEILYELKDHIVGLNCGRWDYIFNFVKRFSKRADFIMPERAEVGMDKHFLSSYSQLLIKTCHKRGAHAMGGMAAQIPIKNDETANQAALTKVTVDKQREAQNGHDGTWVAHPALISTAKTIFDKAMPKANQLDNTRADVDVSEEDLLQVPQGKITEAGLRNNINVALLYITAWLDGMGCVPIHNLMEDAATAEISRTQLWQWRVHGAKLDDGRLIDAALIEAMLNEEVEALQGQAFVGAGKLSDAVNLLIRLVMDDVLEEFLTGPAYELVLKYEKEQAA